LAAAPSVLREMSHRRHRAQECISPPALGFEMTAAAAARAAIGSVARLICERYLLAGVSLHTVSCASLVRKSLPAFARADQRVGAAASRAAAAPTSIGMMSAAQRREEGRGEARRGRDQSAVARSQHSPLGALVTGGPPEEGVKSAHARALSMYLRKAGYPPAVRTSLLFAPVIIVGC